MSYRRVTCNSTSRVRIRVFVQGNINFDSYLTTYLNGQSSGNSSLASSVLFQTDGNFNLAALNLYEFYGTVFAPNGSVSLSVGQMDGSIMSAGSVVRDDLPDQGGRYSSWPVLSLAASNADGHYGRLGKHGCLAHEHRRQHRELLARGNGFRKSRGNPIVLAIRDFARPGDSGPNSHADFFHEYRSQLIDRLGKCRRIHSNPDRDGVAHGPRSCGGGLCQRQPRADPDLRYIASRQRHAEPPVPDKKSACRVPAGLDLDSVRTISDPLGGSSAPMRNRLPTLAPGAMSSSFDVFLDPKRNSATSPANISSICRTKRTSAATPGRKR